MDTLKEFRNTIYSHFNKRKDAVMNLLDAISSFGHQSRSVVQLSEARCFDRQYSSITDAISDGLPSADWASIEKYMFETMFDTKPGRPPCFIVDCTPNPRPFSNKLADKVITHCPNPAPGNKPICVGHQYSCLALLPTDGLERQKKWMIPLSMKRVGSFEKGNEVGMKQVVAHIASLNLTNNLVVSAGDSLYGTERCRIIAGGQENLVHIFRVNANRNLYCLPAINENTCRGRKKEYGAKMKLSDPKAYPKPNQTIETAWMTRSEKVYRVKIDGWENMLIRGSKSYRSSKHPMTLLRIRVFNDKDELVFKRPLWIAIFGKRRHEISLISAYQYYASRYDIEHFFRFGKNKLLLNAYQTADVEHEENWWQLCALAYNQLYLAKSLVSQLPKPWEKYLPEYRETTSNKNKINTPSQTQRGFDTVLKKIGTPAALCIPRGKSSGRVKGQAGFKRDNQKIIFKTKKLLKILHKINFPEPEFRRRYPNPKEINDLVQHVHLTLNELRFPAKQFAHMLCDTS